MLETIVILLSTLIIFTVSYYIYCSWKKIVFNGLPNWKFSLEAVKIQWLEGGKKVGVRVINIIDLNLLCDGSSVPKWLFTNIYPTFSYKPSLMDIAQTSKANSFQTVSQEKSFSDNRGGWTISWCKIISLFSVLSLEVTIYSISLQTCRLSDMFLMGKLFSSKSSFSECFTCRSEQKNTNSSSSLVSLLGLLCSDSPSCDL